MKKILITAAALSVAGTAFANTTAIDVALTKPAGGILNSGNSVLEWNTGTYGNNFDNWEISFNVNLTLGPVNADLFSTGRSEGGTSGYIFSVNADGTFEWYLKGAGTSEIGGTWANGVEALTITLSYDGNKLTASNGKGDEFSLAASGVTLDSGVASFWTNGAKETYSGITVKNTSVVPEPSAFGLLAGMGALALVVSRRRRR